MRKLRHCEIKHIAQGHSVNKLQSQGFHYYQWLQNLIHYVLLFWVDEDMNESLHDWISCLDFTYAYMKIW